MPRDGCGFFRPLTFAVLVEWLKWLARGLLRPLRSAAGCFDIVEVIIHMASRFNQGTKKRVRFFVRWLLLLL